MARKVAVWDFPTRAFHWLLLLLVITSVTTAKLGGEWMVWHERSGLSILSLIIFRIVWGFIGGEHARFTSFVKSPVAVLQYARTALRSTQRHLGHNPLGGYSVLALLASLATQATTGLFADDEIATQGPLAAKVSSATSILLTRIHHYNEKVLYFLIAMHIAAILFYVLKKKQTLVRPMITGETEWDGGGAHDRAKGSVVLAAILFAAIAAIVYYATRRGG